MLAAPGYREHPRSLRFRDGLGERFVAADADSGELVQILRLPRALVDAPAFEFALRERISRLANFRHPAFVRAYRVLRTDAPAPGLFLISEHVEGIRLSDLLRVARQREVDVDISTALFVVRQLLQATVALHHHAADVAGGLIGPERLIVTAKARIAIAEQVACVAIEQLRYPPERLWRELRVPVGPGTGATRFSHRTDVLSIGLVALALVLGRPLGEDEFAERIAEVLDQTRERSALGYERPLSPPLRDWFERTLQLDPPNSFSSVLEASRRFDHVVAEDPLYLSAPIVLESFLYRCTAALIESPPTDSPSDIRTEFSDGPFDDPGTRPETSSSGFRMSGAGPAKPTVTPDAIDWNAISVQPAAVATAGDIAQLFSDADLQKVSETASVPSDEPRGPASPFGRAWAPDLPDGGPQPLIEETAEPLPHEMDDPSFEAHCPTRGKRFQRWSMMRKLTVAAALAGILPGGLVVARLLRPAVVAASTTGTLRVETRPEGLEIFLDGVARGRTPARLSTATGDHLLEIRGQGTPRVVPVKVAAGAETVQMLEFATQPPKEHAAATSHLPPVSIEPAAAAAPTWGWIEVKTEGPIDVHLDDKVVRATGGQRIRAAAGRHEIQLVNDAKGYRAVRVAHVVPGKVTPLVTDAPATGVLNLNASPWAEVWIGGRRVGETPLANVSVAVGRHEVVFRHPDLGEKREAISVTAGAPVRLSMNMK